MADDVEEWIYRLKFKKMSEKVDLLHKIGNSGDKRGVPVLIDHLAVNNDDVINISLIGLGNLRDKSATEHIIPFLKKKGKNAELIQRSAAEALGKIADKSATQPLIESLTDKKTSKAVKLFIIDALGDIKAEEAIPHLSNILKTEKDSSVTAALMALSKIGGAESVDVIEKILVSSDSLDSRATAAKCLGELGDPIAVRSLIDALEDPVDYVREKALEAIGKLESSMVNKKPEEVIAKFYNEKIRQRRNSVPYEKMGDLKKYFKSEDPDETLNALYTLSTISDPKNKNLDMIQDALKHEDRDARMYAVYLLGASGNKQYAKAISQLQNDKSALVKKAVAEAIENMDYIPSDISKYLEILASEESNPRSRLKAAKSLSQLNNETIIEPFCSYLIKNMKQVDDDLIAVNLQIIDGLVKFDLKKNESILKTFDEAFREGEFEVYERIYKVFDESLHPIAVAAMKYPKRVNFSFVNRINIEKFGYKAQQLKEKERKEQEAREAKKEEEFKRKLEEDERKAQQLIEKTRKEEERVRKKLEKDKEK